MLNRLVFLFLVGSVLATEIPAVIRTSGSPYLLRASYTWYFDISDIDGAVQAACVVSINQTGTAQCSFLLPVTAMNVTCTPPARLVAFRPLLLNLSNGPLTYSYVFHQYETEGDFKSGDSFTLNYSWPDGAFLLNGTMFFSLGERFLMLNSPGTVNILVPSDTLAERPSKYTAKSVLNRTWLTRDIGFDTFTDPLVIHTRGNASSQVEEFDLSHVALVAHWSAFRSDRCLANLKKLGALLERAIDNISNMTGYLPGSRVKIVFVPYDHPQLGSYYDGRAYLDGGAVFLRYGYLYREFEDDSVECLTLVHEVVHSLTPSKHVFYAYYPSLWLEGIATIISWKTMSDMGYERVILADRRSKFGSIDPSLLDHVWLPDWTIVENKSIVSNNYGVASFIFDSIVHKSGYGFIRAFHSRVLQEGIMFFPFDKDFFLRRLEEATGINTTIFRDFGDEISKMNIGRKQLDECTRRLSSLRSQWYNMFLPIDQILSDMKAAELAMDKTDYESSVSLSLRVLEQLKVLEGFWSQLESMGRFLAMLLVLAVVFFIVVKKKRVWEEQQSATY